MNETARFTAVTYNVLADSYLRRDRYPKSPAAALEPGHRHPLLVERIAQLKPDLLFLQELEAPVYQALVARLGATHESVYAPRQKRAEGSGIFARRDRLRWNGSRVIHFEHHRPGDDDLAVIASLEFQGVALEAAGTHLTWQPDGTAPDQHIGRNQLIELLAHRDASHPDRTWIVAGDFNAISQSVVLEAAYARGMAESCTAQRPWDTTAINGRVRKLDYLIYSTGKLVPTPGTLPKLDKDAPPPTMTEPSDHLPLAVEFALP